MPNSIPHTSRSSALGLITIVTLCCTILSGSVLGQSFQSNPPASPSLPSSSKSGYNDGSLRDMQGDPFNTPIPGTVMSLPIAVPAAPAPISATISNPAAATNPAGDTIGATSASLTSNASAWTPVMGEFHYSRYPASEWRDELLKMKAGGIDIVATYVFWIHHEEIEGHFDWTGDRDLRRFVELCRELEMKVVVRAGPWCHGEVRNGGLPDWLLASGCRVRSDDPRYMDKVRILYAEVFKQISGLLWKDGGPVIGFQLENEYRGAAEHLLNLKKMAIEAGIVVPLYTRTGWPALTTPMPLGEIIPLYGVYAEGFWDRELTPMPGNYWTGFVFTTLRTDSNIANEALGRSGVTDDPDVASYPYLTCEIGGGMMSSYHRRILVDPRDIESTTLVKLGSGSVLPGYYMYHGGTNPDAATPGLTLQENQSTPFTNWNDLPEKNYDFQAPLGAAGQYRPQYHLLRRQHLFVHDFGYLLAGMPTVLPERRPNGQKDVATLRWSLRSNGRSGFIFVNNYQRLRPMPVHQGIQFGLNLPPLETVSPHTSITTDSTPGAVSDAVRRATDAQAVSQRMVPVSPVDIPADRCFLWPFNLDLGHGAILAYATAQPLCYAETDDEKARTYFFAEIPGIVPELAFADTTVRQLSYGSGRQRKGDGLVRITNLKTSHSPAITLRSGDGYSISIVILSDAESLQLYKLPWGDNDRVFLSPHPITVETDDSLRVHSPTGESVQVLVYPSPDPRGVKSSKGSSIGRGLLALFTGIAIPDGVFAKLTVPGTPQTPVKLAAPKAEKIREAGPAREIPMGKAPKPVAAAPTNTEFAAAAAWKITLPKGLTAENAPLLRIPYTGDVARVLLDGKVIVDDFYNGLPLDVPLARYWDKISNGGTLTLEILPLKANAPIMVPESAHPKFGRKDSIVSLGKLEIKHTYTLKLTPTAMDGEGKPTDEED